MTEVKHLCEYRLAWVGPCEDTRTVPVKLLGGRHERPVYFCTKPRNHGKPHSEEVCSCGRKAIAECENAGSLVCGFPTCTGTYCHSHGG